jgi:hypothetical protein
MSIRFVDTQWGGELRNALAADANSLRFICLFTKTSCKKPAKSFVVATQIKRA